MAAFGSWFQLLLLCIEWLHAHTIGPLVDVLDEGVLASWEEAAKLFIREFFTTGSRLINGACSWALALSDRQYRQNLRCTWQQKEAWHSWWREERTSTLNAVLAAQCPAPSAADEAHARRTQSAARSSSLQQRSRQRSARISWQEHPSNTTSSSSTQLPALAIPSSSSSSSSSTRPVSPSAAAAAVSPKGSVLAQLVARVNVDLLGRSKASPAVLAAATGRSSNPLLQHTPSMPRFPSMASLPSCSSNSLQELAGNGQHLQETLAGNGETLQQQWQQQQQQPVVSQVAWQLPGSAAAPPQQQQQRAGLLRRLLTLLWRCAFAPLLPFTWVWAVTLGRFMGGSKEQQQQQQGLEYAYAQSCQPDAAPGAATAVAAAAAAARGPRRSIVFEQPSGFGVHERSKRRGLLEELCLGGELFVTGGFEAMRWLVRLLTLTRPRPTIYSHSRAGSLTAAAAARQQRRLAAAAARAAADGDFAGAPAAEAFGVPKQRRRLQQQQNEPQMYSGSTAGGLLYADSDRSSSCSSGSEDEGQQPPQFAASGSSSSSSAAAAGAAGVGRARRKLQHSKSVGSDMAQLSLGTARGASALPRLTMRRVRSVGRWNHAGEPQPAVAAAAAAGVSEDELSPAAQMILKAGYPLELHQVTTADGYVLRIERIPRPGSPRVAFFLHGILDTSLTWVSAGVTGSQAFGAWDAGQDVWLGSSRSNPPRTATDPDRQGLRYFNFSLNELGIHDIPAQLDLLLLGQGRTA